MKSSLKPLQKSFEIETLLALLALSISVIAMSFSAIFIKFSEEASLSPNATVFNRLWITAATLALFSGIRFVGEQFSSKEMERQDAEVSPPNQHRMLLLMVLVGISYAVYQCTWAWSLAKISIAVSTLLHNLTPVFMSLVAWLIFHQQYSSRFWFGMFMAIGGATILCLEGGDLTWGALEGNLAALASAILFGMYLSAVDRLRTMLDTARMLMWSSLVGCALILPILLTNHDMIFPMSGSGWSAVTVLAMIQVIGQGLIIYSMKMLSPSIVALSIVLDPVLTVIEAWLIFSEQLSLISWLSCLICLLGVYLSVVSQPAQDPAL